MATKKSYNGSCLLCDKQFDTKTKGPKRTNVFSYIPQRTYTLSDALKILDVVVSPLKVKQKFCCSSCTSHVKDAYCIEFGTKK